MSDRRGDSAGFTLIEMLVVLGLIIMTTAIALPNIAAIIRANADAQAHNLMSGLIKSGRITAMRDGVYASVHHQLASPDSPSNRRLAGSSFAAVLTLVEDYVTGGARWELAHGQTPKRFPSTMVFGEVKAPEGAASPGTYVSGGYNAEGVGGSGQDVKPGSSNDIHLKDFTTFTLVFTPLGGLTCMPNKQDVFFTADEYEVGESVLFGSDDPLWMLDVANADSDGDGQVGEPGARVITMFDYSLFSRRLGDDRVTFLNENAQLMPINVLLGMLVERK